MKPPTSHVLSQFTTQCLGQVNLIPTMKSRSKSCKIPCPSLMGRWCFDRARLGYRRVHGVMPGLRADIGPSTGSIGMAVMIYLNQLHLIQVFYCLMFAWFLLQVSNSPRWLVPQRHQKSSPTSEETKVLGVPEQSWRRPAVMACWTQIGSVSTCISQVSHMIHMEVSWNGGYPQIIYLKRILQYKPSSYWGTPIYGNPHM